MGLIGDTDGWGKCGTGGRGGGLGVGCRVSQEQWPTGGGDTARPSQLIPTQLAGFESRLK